VEEILKWTAEEFGNAGSRTHSYGQVAKTRVKVARDEIASVVGAQPDEVIFTSGATESNNLAILGLAEHGRQSGRRHIVCSAVEHKAVLEPVESLRTSGFEVTVVPPTEGGWVDAEDVRQATRPDTLLVSVMAVNNETGVIQPIEEIAENLSAVDTYFHVDAAQAFGKLISPLRQQRIDMISVSGHKVHGPKGVGALVARRRRFNRPPLRPLMFGGGQERSLRPGTLPVAAIAGLGLAASLALDEHASRDKHCRATQLAAVQAFAQLGAVFNGDLERTVSHTLNLSVPGVDSEAAIVALKDVAAISNGSACTSQSYEPSHVLLSAGLSEERIAGALRLSWSYLTANIDWEDIAKRLSAIQTTTHR
jgi:cysteine desulfurase